MTKNSGSYGNDLAADLLADLTRSPVLDRLPEPMVVLTAVDPDRPAAIGENRSNGPALDWFLRISPWDWRRPALTLGAQSAAIRFGPVRAELGIRGLAR